jgi:outer membrane protein OmpA-like peptidoglycan-associated protein
MFKPWQVVQMFAIASLCVAGCGTTLDNSQTLRAVDTLVLAPPTFNGVIEDTIVVSTPTTTVLPGSPATFPDEMFDTNKASIRDPAFCEDFATRVRDDRMSPYLRITGYADSRTTAYRGGNEGLSLDRAKAIESCLLGKVPELRERIALVEGVGIHCLFLPDKPANENNRRVVVSVFKSVDEVGSARDEEACSSAS